MRDRFVVITRRRRVVERVGKTSGRDTPRPSEGRGGMDGRARGGKREEVAKKEREAKAFRERRRRKRAHYLL